MIKGITVTLINKKEVGRDPFNRPIYEDVEIEVDNVLVSPVSTEDIVHTLELTGKKAVYTLAIPNKPGRARQADRSQREHHKHHGDFGMLLTRPP